jgi:hypothetical protein
MRYARLLASGRGLLTIAASLVLGASAATAQAPAAPRPNPPAVSYTSSYGITTPAPAPAATARRVVRPAAAVAPRGRRVTPHNEYGRADSYHYKS